MSATKDYYASFQDDGPCDTISQEQALDFVDCAASYYWLFVKTGIFFPAPDVRRFVYAALFIATARVNCDYVFKRQDAFAYPYPCRLKNIRELGKYIKEKYAPMSSLSPTQHSEFRDMCLELAANARGYKYPEHDNQLRDLIERHRLFWFPGHVEVKDMVFGDKNRSPCKHLAWIGKLEISSPADILDTDIVRLAFWAADEAMRD